MSFRTLPVGTDELASSVPLFPDQPKPGYHLRPITVRGTYGQTSKIREELDELEEALEQRNSILALCELADLYGALEGVAEQLGTDMGELAKMAAATRRAFESGDRK